MAERCSWQADARRVVGLHLVNMVIWVLKLLPLLPMEGCWYLLSAPRNLCSIHLRHLRLISDCTCRRSREGRQTGWGRAVKTHRRVRLKRDLKNVKGIANILKSCIWSLDLLTSPFRKQYKTATTKPCWGEKQIKKIAQLGKHLKYLCMNNEREIMTSFKLRQEVYYLDLWEFFPGHIILN